MAALSTPAHFPHKMISFHPWVIHDDKINRAQQSNTSSSTHLAMIQEYTPLPGF